jgi:dihydroxy-acid dehydratase
LRELKPLLHLDCLNISGQTLGERLEGEEGYVDYEVIRPLNDPVEPYGGLVSLFGSLAPQGAIIKRSAADSSLFERKGRAFVFHSLENLSSSIDDPELDVKPDDFLILQNAGPRSGTGMPESGYLPIPAKLSKAGVKDMVRISDARMSGTAYGTIILHVTPEASVGGPLGLVRTGDMIELSVSDRRLDLKVHENELKKRREEMESKPEFKLKNSERGYSWLYQNHVLQADEGCDFDFLKAK